MITSEEECKEAILDLGLPRIFASTDNFDTFPRGCWCYDLEGPCFINTHHKGSAAEGSFALCKKFPSYMSSWVYPNAARLDIDGRSGHTSFGSIGVGACQDADGNHYPVKQSTEVASPTACRDFCLNVGYTEGLVGFGWSSSDNTCNCSIDAHVYGLGSGTGRMGDPDGQAGSSCFERRYAIIGEDVLDDDRASGSVTSTGPNDDSKLGYTNGLVGFQWSSSDNTCNCSIDAHVYGSGSGTGRMGDPNGQAGSTCFERRYAIISEDVLDDDRASGSVTSTGPNDDDRASGSVTSTGPNDDDRASGSVTSTGPSDDDRASDSVTSTGPNDDDRASGSVTSTVNSLRTSPVMMTEQVTVSQAQVPMMMTEQVAVSQAQ
eukprot:CAMPEP_0171324984 /NCGR_PEP_ID=MMETSP0816-20121228/116524_1 /TAXON_ID=420281 /ORGANISM="Proboscia inermis, Strain CCAP1064/1" /LENGTH=375 /DNA_ID=CAMNT_0011824063 /DNA_START=1156 /DNA_END=2284 /DNA_ORIENTATION=-